MPRLLLLLAGLLLALSARAEEHTTFPVGAFQFHRPAEWAWVPATSTLRRAQLSVPGPEGSTPAEVTFFYFGPNSGSVAENIARWNRQFDAAPEAAKTENLVVGTTKITFASNEGTFASGMPGQPTTPLPGYALLGAILEHPEGNVFVKMIGPAALLQVQRPRFMEFIREAARTPSSP